MILLETTTFADAGAMLEACRSELEKSGFQSHADKLKGLEVFDFNGAEVALFTLRSMSSTGNASMDSTIQYTEQAILEALLERRLAS